MRLYDKNRNRIMNVKCFGKDLTGLKLVAPYTGLIYVAVSDFLSYPPPRFTKIGYGVQADTDCAGSTKTTYTATIGQVTGGLWNFNFDADWRAVKFQAGKAYSVGTNGASPGALLSIRDRKGKELASSADSPTAVIYDVQAPCTGTYYIATQDHNSGGDPINILHQYTVNDLSKTFPGRRQGTR